MPRRPRVGHTLVQRRTRTGCSTCRSRKIKCDEAKPTCVQCKAKGLTCSTTTTLKWEAEYLSRGLSFGRAGVWSKAPFVRPTVPPSRLDSAADVAVWCPLPRIYAYSFVNATVATFQELTELTIAKSESQLEKLERATIWTSLDTDLEQAGGSPSKQGLARPVTSSIPLANFVLLRNTREKSMLLSYYLESLCPMTVSSSSSTSPFASLLIPFAVTKSPLVMESILALAACHRARENDDYKGTALQLSQQALRTLRAKLTAGHPQQVARDPEILITMLLLCMFEIVSECNNRWVVHLKGARDLIRVRREHCISYSQDSSTNELALFCERFFAFQDVIGRTACGEVPVFESAFWVTDRTDCDPWLGCSLQLVSILSEITELSRESSTLRTTTAFQAASAALERRLGELNQNVYDVDDRVLGQVAESKRLAAELYLHCALNGTKPSTPWVADQVCRILLLVAEILEIQVVPGISWPLFVAAVELDPEHDFQLESGSATEGSPRYARSFVLYALDRLAGSMGNVTRTRSVIEKVWQARELQPEGSSMAQNDWENFVAPLCGSLSLA
ncbi:fungal-specific transcription factor domain-containing protein [Aspergillus varians]